MSTVCCSPVVQIYPARLIVKSHRGAYEKYVSFFLPPFYATSVVWATKLDEQIARAEKRETVARRAASAGISERDKRTLEARFTVGTRGTPCTERIRAIFTRDVT